MSAGAELRLPEPARSLWLRTRDAIRQSLAEIDVSEYAIGGGTILAARWMHHRASDDIDLTLPASARLDRLDDRRTCGFHQRLERLGGNPERHGAVYRIAFGGQGIDLWPHRAVPPAMGAYGTGRFDDERRRTTYRESSSAISAYVQVSTTSNSSPTRFANVCAV